LSRLFHSFKKKVTVCIHFKIHHPYLLKSYSVQQIDADHYYFDDVQTKKNVTEFVDDSILPLNELLVTQQKNRKQNITLSISGTVIELLRSYRLDAVESLRELIKKRKVQVVQSVYYNSLSEYFSLGEYKDQVLKHSWLLQEVFGITPIQNLCHDHHTCSKLLSVDYAHVKTESDFQNIQQSIEENQMHTEITSQLSSWNKGYEKKLLQKLYGLEKLTKYVNDGMLLNDWRSLQDVVYYSVDAGLEALTHIKNILSDFEIVMIKKYLTKIKRKERDIPVIL
jgi:hypothetical protein